MRKKKRKAQNCERWLLLSVYPRASQTKLYMYPNMCPPCMRRQLKASKSLLRGVFLFQSSLHCKAARNRISFGNTINPIWYQTTASLLSPFSLLSKLLLLAMRSTPAFPVNFAILKTLTPPHQGLTA